MQLSTDFHNPIQTDGVWRRELSLLDTSLIYHCACCGTPTYGMAAAVPSGATIHNTLLEVETMNIDTRVRLAWCLPCTDRLAANQGGL